MEHAVKKQMGSREKWAKAIHVVVLVGLIGTPLVCLTAFGIKDKLSSDLMDVMRNGQDPAKVRKLLRQGADPNTSEGYPPRYPIVIAASCCNATDVHLLLNAGASVVTNPKSEPGRGTPFFAVVDMSGTSDADVVDIIHALYEKGEKLEERDSLGYTPLLHAVEFGNLAAVRTFLELRADFHAVNNQHWDIWVCAKYPPVVVDSFCQSLLEPVLRTDFVLWQWFRLP